MKFDYQTYLFNDLLFPVLILLFLATGWLGILRDILSQREKKNQLQIGKWLFCVVILSFLSSIHIRTLSSGSVWLILERPEHAEITTGILEASEQYGVMNGHKYSTDSQGTQFGCRITVNGEEYHVVTTGDLQIGDEVTVTYLPRSGYVLYIGAADRR